MTPHRPPDPRPRPPHAGTFGQQLRAHGVHLYTASGVVFAFLAVAELCAPQPDPRWVFGWLAVAGLVTPRMGLWRGAGRSPAMPRRLPAGRSMTLWTI